MATPIEEQQEAAAGVAAPNIYAMFGGPMDEGSSISPPPDWGDEEEMLPAAAQSPQQDDRGTKRPAEQSADQEEAAKRHSPAAETYEPAKVTPAPWPTFKEEEARLEK